MENEKDKKQEKKPNNVDELKIKYADMQIARENLAFQLQQINDEMNRLRAEMQKQGGK